MKIELKENIMYPTSLTYASVMAIKTILEKDIQERQELSTLKGGAAANSDGWHDETFKLIEEQGRINKARLSLLIPGITLETLKEVQIIEPNKNKKIGLGSKIIVLEEEKEEYILVSSLDTKLNPSNDERWISIDSPVGKALVGKERGGKVAVNTPGGIINIEILEVGSADELSPEKPEEKGEHFFQSEPS